MTLSNKKALTASVPDKGYLDSFTGYWLKQAYGAVLSDADNRLQPLGITAPEFTILATISFNPGIIQSRLVEHLYITRSTASELIERLVGKGLVDRQPIDRKSKGLYVTDNAEKVLGEARKIVGNHNRRAVAHMSTEEVETLIRLLRKLARKPD